MQLLTQEGIARTVQQGLKDGLELDLIVRYLQVKAGSEFLNVLCSSRLGDEFPNILTTAENYQLEVAAFVTEFNSSTVK